MDLSIALAAFVTLFVIIDPLAVAPIFVALTGHLETGERRAAALRACLMAAGVLTVFGLFGQILLDTIGISLPAFRISGGLLLFLIAVEMLFEKRTQRRSASAATAPDPSVFPIAVPLIAGPGAMATMVLLAAQHGSTWQWLLVVHAMLALVLLLTFAMFRAGSHLDRLLGRNGINVVTRLFGILLAALAVQIVLDGLGSYGLVPV